jgi:microcystin-dependent protein
MTLRWLQNFEVGEIRVKAHKTADHNGWLLCDGRAISRTTYAGLFAEISTAFGVGDGSTTFNIPDTQGRAIAGTGNGSGLTARARNDKVGVETHILTTAQMPSHNHGYAGGTGVPTVQKPTTSLQPATNDIFTASQGSDQPHPNMQPTIFIPTFIYSGV